ncbi:MAG: phosphocholine cytidylyltransferase family protein [Candidatus Cloacimonetes bacterium]|nr:phosphocholine cytidylyltransferase family protein [Candidatus Cloacimonadota bacterium]
MKAIILAAGVGKRLREISRGMPKSMLQIGSSSIMHHQIRSCQQAGIENFVFVLGYKKELLQDHILEILAPGNTTFITNPVYDKTNTLYSLWLARQHFTEEFIYFNSDVIFQTELLMKIVPQSEFSQLLIEDKICGKEEVKVIVSDDMRILEIGKELDISRCIGEFIGIGKFNQQVLNRFSEHLQTGVDTGHQNNYFEYAVNLLAGDFHLQAVFTGDLPCIEIDFPEDLLQARKLFS